MSRADNNINLIRKVNLLDNRLNIIELKFNLYSILPEYILSKDLFPRNEDLKYFINATFYEYKFKDYLFDSRTLLLARIIREIHSIEDKKFLVNINNFITQHIADVYLIDANKSEYQKRLIELYNKYSRRG